MSEKGCESMKKLRFLTAFIVICSLTLTFVQASAPSPTIAFENNEETEAAAIAAYDTGRQAAEADAVPDNGDADDWQTAIRGFFSMKRSLYETTASAAPQQEAAQTAGASIRSLFVNSVTYVSVRDFVTYHCPEASFSYDGSKVKVSCNDYYMEFFKDAIYYYVNGRILPLSSKCFEQDGCFYVPLRALAVIYSYDVAWDKESFTATLADNGKELVSGKDFYDYDDYILLAKLIRAESGNQPLEGKIAVGNVIMNRVDNASFPDTISGVIYDRRCGVQFTTAYNGSLNKAPTEECLIAAKLCLEGYSVTDDSLYFFNPKVSSSNWIKNNRKYVTTIGNHVFYS